MHLLLWKGMDKEKCKHAITDQSHVLHSQADFALDALFVHTAEQKKSQVRRSVTAMLPAAGSGQQRSTTSICLAQSDQSGIGRQSV